MMKTTTDLTSTREWLSRRRAILGVVGVVTLLVLSGCTTGGSSSDTTVASTTQPATAGQPTTTAASTPSTAPINAKSVLDTALAQYTEGYQFQSVVTVGDEQAAEVTGIVVDTTAQMDVVSGDGTASYLTTPEGSWVRIEGGEWQEVESDGPFDAPLDALASPTSINVIGSGADGIVIVGVYDGSAFTTDDPVELKMIFKDGLLINASYSTEEATVTTSFGPLDGATIDDPTASSA